MSAEIAKLRYRIACAREALEVAANAIEEAQHWIYLIHDDRQQRMDYEAQQLLDLIRQVSFMDQHLMNLQ